MYNFNMSLSPGRTYRYFEGSPLWHFGYGLSYTTFSYNCTGIQYQINCTLINTGTRHGDEVLQIYHRVSQDIIDSVDHPVPIRALVEFERYSLAKGEKLLVRFNITDSMYTLTNNDGDKVIYPGVHYFDVTNGVNPASTITVNIPEIKIYDVAPRGFKQPPAP